MEIKKGGDMEEVQYERVQDRIPIDAERTLSQLTSPFQKVEDGLPELVKNSKDHYSRLGIHKKEDRQIVVIVSGNMDRIGVLDFGGATLDNFSNWMEWSRKSDEDALTSDIEAGHGNGGKSFMVRGARKNSFMCGLANGVVNKMGFINNKEGLLYHPVFFKTEYGMAMKNMECDLPEELLNEELLPFGITTDNLPQEALEVFERRKSFTFVHINGVSDWMHYPVNKRRRLISQFLDDLVAHPQVSSTLQSSTVWVQIVKTKELYGPLALPPIDPFETLEDLPKIPIPDKLFDPAMKEEISTGVTESDENYLEIKTSRRNLRMSEKLKGRNVIRIKNGKNFIANWNVANLVPISASAFVYGELQCLSLTDDFLTGANRDVLVDKPLVRALKHWVAEKINEIAKKIQSLQSTTFIEEHEDEASETLDKIRELMKQYLTKEESGFTGGKSSALSSTGEAGSGFGSEGDEGASPQAPEPPKKYGTKIDTIVLEEEEKRMTFPLGTTVPLIVKCYENCDGRQIPTIGATVVLRMDKPGIVEQEGNNSVKGISQGSVTVWFETQDGEVKSNRIELKTIKLGKVEIFEPGTPIKQKEKIKIRIEAKDEDGTVMGGLIYETHIDEIEMGTFNRSGYFTAGGVAGRATLRVVWGPDEEHISSCVVEISKEKLEKKKGSVGGGIPYILLCGRTAPGREDLPEEQRTHPGGEEYPTIIDFEPIWEMEPKVVWINHRSSEALKVRTSRGAIPVDLDTKTFQQFMALKCFEVLKRLIVKEQSRGKTMTPNEFFDSIGSAEMECSGFIGAAYDLVDRIISGVSQEE